MLAVTSVDVKTRRGAAHGAERIEQSEQLSCDARVVSMCTVNNRDHTPQLLVLFCLIYSFTVEQFKLSRHGY